MTTFITTPIFYASGDPHTGHAYSAIIADIHHRFRTLSGERSILITGTDEHGQKIASTAGENHVSISDFIEAKAANFAKLWPELAIQPDINIRTTQSDHKAHIAEVWQQLLDQGDVYLGTYSGEYCTACEQYYPQRELVDDCCPIHKKPVETVSEATYLFRLENYRQQLLDYYQAHPNLISPAHFQDSIIKQLQADPLDNLSISRVNNSWGIPVPNDPQHTIYVWIDALFSYITAIQRSGNNSQAIADTVHVLGKDILQFHALYWPVFLLALGYPLPEKLIIHGWWTIEGEKISKSNPATAVNPKAFSNQLTTDGFRYALVRQKPLSRDGNLSLEEFTEVINADLANNLANLVKRNNTLIVNHFEGKLTETTAQRLDEECRQILISCQRRIDQVISSYLKHALYQVTLELKQVLDLLNAFFHHRTPWLISKGQDRKQVTGTCFVVSNILRQVALCYAPITPQLATSILAEQCVSIDTAVLRNKITLKKVTLKGARSHFQRIKV